MIQPAGKRFPSFEPPFLHLLHTLDSHISATPRFGSWPNLGQSFPDSLSPTSKFASSGPFPNPTNRGRNAQEMVRTGEMVPDHRARPGPFRRDGAGGPGPGGAARRNPSTMRAREKSGGGRTRQTEAQIERKPKRRGFWLGVMPFRFPCPAEIHQV